MRPLHYLLLFDLDPSDVCCGSRMAIVMSSKSEITLPRPHVETSGLRSLSATFTVRSLDLLPGFGHCQEVVNYLQNLLSVKI